MKKKDISISDDSVFFLKERSKYLNLIVLFPHSNLYRGVLSLRDFKKFKNPSSASTGLLPSILVITMFSSGEIYANLFLLIFLILFFISLPPL
ncbi:MAG: hypothetical protein Q4P31_04280 [Andreesenia angusta]|nr:hypothetical protein [Andreesenia angusta]